MKDSPPPPPPPPPPQFITKNSLVEVSSEEDGFRGVWFEATIISPPPPSSKKKKNPTRKAYIEYKSLVSDEKLLSPLREHVDVLFVRPLPPPIEENSKVFELYDVVDAFFKDGWWVGVITRVFEERGRFLVTFQNPFDEIEFGGDCLRIHLDWVDNEWVRPPKQKLTALMFGEGKEVEVLIKRKNNQDVWYPAIVVENDADSSFLVEYKVLKEGTNMTLSGCVDCSQIRPSPPPLKSRCFDLLEKVDAFHEFGWCAGLVTKELPDNRYTVFFQSMKREREFDHIDVRPQLNWKDGKWWFTSSQEEVTPFQQDNGCPVGSEIKDISSRRNFKTKGNLKGKRMEKKPRISSSSRESISCEILSDSPCTPKGVLVGTNLEETKFPSLWLGKNQTDHVDLDHAKSHDVASSPKTAKHTMEVTTHLAEKLKRGGGAVTPSRTSSQQNTAMVDKQNGRISSTSGSPPSNIPGDDMLVDLTGEDQPSDNPSLGKTTPKKRKKIDPKENHKISSRRKRGQADEEGNTGFTEGAEHVELDSGGKMADTPVILGLECCKLSGSKARKTAPSNGEEFLKLEGDQKKQLNDLPEQDKGVSCGSKARKPHLNNGEEFLKLEGHQKKQPNDLLVQEKGDQSEAAKSSNKRKRGRPKKVSVGSVNAGLTEQNKVTVNDDIIIKDCTTSEVDTHVAPDSMLSMGGLLPAESSLMPVSNCIKLVDAQLNCRNDLASTIRQSSSRTPTDSNDQALVSEHERQMYKKAKRRTSENNISQISDSSDGTVVKRAEPFCIKEIRTVLQEPGMLDDQPLSTWFEKKHTSAPGASTAMTVEKSIEIRQTNKDVNGQTTFADDNRTDTAMSKDVDAQSRVIVDGDTVLEQCVELRQTRKDLNGQTTSAKDNKTVAFMGEEVDGDTSITTASEPELPFVKHSSLWKAIESLEAFRKMPQKPHFRPLQQYKESLREGFAIAFMVNFSSAVEKISMLRLDDTKEKINDILESLKDLESHGFGVQVLEDRITELESIKENHSKLYEEVDVINKKIVSCKFDKFDQDKEISEVAKQIKKLQERIATAESIKEMKDREIAVLESRRQEAEETIGSSRSRYAGLASGVL